MWLLTKIRTAFLPMDFDLRHSQNNFPIHPFQVNLLPNCWLVDDTGPKKMNGALLLDGSPDGSSYGSVIARRAASEREMNLYRLELDFLCFYARHRLSL